MNDILTIGSEIKQRIIAEIQKSSQNIFLAMAFVRIKSINFTTNLPVILNDTDIKEEAKKITKILNELLE